jgi:hypothetical protein
LGGVFSGTLDWDDSDMEDFRDRNLEWILELLK